MYTLLVNSGDSEGNSLWRAPFPGAEVALWASRAVGVKKAAWILFIWSDLGKISMEWGQFPGASAQEAANPQAEPGQQVSGTEVPRPLE